MRGGGARGSHFRTDFGGVPSLRRTSRATGDWLSGVDIADVLFEFLEQASEAVQAGNTYPLLDAPTAEFVAAVEGTGFAEVSASAADRGRYSGLAGDLLRRLPLFELARIDEVLDIRRDLRVPLLGFRASGRGVRAERLRSAAWEQGFAEEAEALFREKVEPEVEKIEYAVKENSSYAELGRRALRHGGTGVAGGGRRGVSSRARRASGPFLLQRYWGGASADR